MEMQAAESLTALLNNLNGGEGDFARLVDAVYDDLKKVAARRVANRFDRPSALTLQPTAILHDALMDLRRQHQRARNSGQFFAIATTLIERVISDYRKRRRAKKRGGARRAVPLNSRLGEELESPGGVDFPPVMEVLEKLKSEYPRKAEVVSLHMICGHPLPKVAEMIELSLAQTERDWSFARKWMKRELASEGASP